jgi:hypothetical protein
MRNPLLLALLVSSAAHAQAPAAPNAPSAPAELRTLFHSASEREALDRIRRGDPPEEVASTKRAPPGVTGFVKRSDGRDTVWLDGRAVTGAEAKRLAESAKAPEPASGNRAIEIKPSR